MSDLIPMEKSKEAELVFAVLSYASRCIAEGDLHSLRQVGFEPDDIPQIESLSLADMRALAGARGHAVKVSLDRPTWGYQLRRVLYHRERERLSMALIRLGAPMPMMASLFGYTRNDYINRKTALGIADNLGGRPATPDKAEQERLWKLWLHLAKPDHPQQLADDNFWVAIAHEVSPLRMVWSTIQSWAHDGHMLAAFQRERSQIKGAAIRSMESELRARFGILIKQRDSKL